MKKTNRVLKYSKKIASILMIILQIKTTGTVSNFGNAHAVKSYHKIVESFADFLQQEGIEEPQHIYEYYNYALWNGYFSRNHTLSYNTDRKVFLDNAGMSIMSSNGVCLNYADMLSLVFKAMGLNSFVVTCYVDSDNVEIEKVRHDREIVRNIVTSNNDTNNSNEEINSSEYYENDNITDESEFSLNDILNSSFVKNISNGISNLVGNHAITCVEYDGELYFFDPTNLAYLTKTGINDLSIINGTGKFDLKYLSSMLIDDLSSIKIMPYQNNTLSFKDILANENIVINQEALEAFYLSQYDNINTVALNSHETNNFLSVFVSVRIAQFILYFSLGLFPNIILKHFERADVKYLFPKLKTYFEEQNIKTELEVLKNYELIANELGITDNISKDILRKAIEVFKTLIFDDQFKQQLMVLCLNNLGYQAVTKYARKYSSKFSKKSVPLIIYSNGENNYMYDYETGELLYQEGNVIKSLDGKYIYKLSRKEKYPDMAKEDILKKMNDESIQLTQEDIQNLRKSKVLKR